MTTTQDIDTFPLGLMISIYVPEDDHYPSYDYVGTVVKVEPDMITIETDEGATAYAFDGEWDVLDPFADVPAADAPSTPDESDGWRDDDDVA